MTLLLGVWAVLGWWYPRSFWVGSGVLSVGAYAVVVHVVTTALLVLPWRTRRKVGAEVVADIGVLLWILLSTALLSLSVLAAERPVALVYAVDRVVLVRASELRTIEFTSRDLAALHHLRWSGPLPLLATRPSNDFERLEAIELAMAGFDLPQRPSRWVDNVQTQRGAILDRARAFGGETTGVISVNGVELTHYLPLDGLNGDWVLAVDTRLRNHTPMRLEQVLRDSQSSGD
ncbi:hypothetical protein [Hydrogenophaga palleronii]|uniref:hypothetical protein n=1 Tax=Hydrogenophaga palleronii TaxID=65655 RepID=UPI0012EE2C4F|nr:hypothetical protein [Hydrogenophaga palleronii]